MKNAIIPWGGMLILAVHMAVFKTRIVRTYKETLLFTWKKVSYKLEEKVKISKSRCVTRRMVRGGGERGVRSKAKFHFQRYWNGSP